MAGRAGAALEAPPTPSSPLPKPCTNPVRKLANQTKLQWERSHEGKKTKHGTGQGKAGQRQLEKPRTGRALPFSFLAKVAKFSSSRETTWQLRRFLRPSPASFPNSLIGPNAAASPALVPACLQLRRSDGGLGLGAGRRGATPAPAEPVSAPGEEEGRGREATPRLRSGFPREAGRGEGRFWPPGGELGACAEPATCRAPPFGWRSRIKGVPPPSPFLGWEECF